MECDQRERSLDSQRVERRDHDAHRQSTGMLFQSQSGLLMLGEMEKQEVKEEVFPHSQSRLLRATQADLRY
jgi:hypothetical protein